MFAAFGFMRQSVGAGGGETTAVTFDAGWAPIPQDPSFTAWTNWGWPRRIQGGSGAARYDRVAVQMYVPGTNVEPLYHDNPVLANGANDSNGAVQIRLAGGSFATSAVVTTKGTWSVNADGKSLSYNPKPRASGWTAGVEETDTQAEYRWSADGGSTWSQAGTLKMTLVPPPILPIRFIEDFNLTPNNLWAGNDSGANTQTDRMQDALDDLDANNGGTLCQRNPSNFYAIIAKENSVRFHDNPVPQTGNGICLYAARIDKGVASPGDRFYRVFTNPGWADTPHGAFLVYFGYNHSHMGQQLAHDSTTTAWNYSFGNEFSYWTIWASNAGATNLAKFVAQWTVWMDGVAEVLNAYQGSDCRARWCDFRGHFRGSYTQTGGKSIVHMDDIRAVHSEIDERGKRVPGPIWSEVDNVAAFDYIVNRALHDARSFMHKIGGTTVNLEWHNVYQNRAFGGCNAFGSGCGPITHCRLMTTSPVVHSTHRFIRHGDGVQLFQNCEIIVTNKGMWVDGALKEPLSSDMLYGYLDWSSGSSNHVWQFDDCDFRVEEGLTGHTGSIFGLRPVGNGGLGIIRLTNTRFHAAQDGKQFTACVANGGSGTLRVEIDGQTSFGGMTKYSGSVNETLI